MGNLQIIARSRSQILLSGCNFPYFNGFTLNNLVYFIGLYDGLLYFLDHAVEKEFLPQATHHTIMSASTANQLIDKLQTYAPKPDPLLNQITEQSSNSN